MNKTLLDLFTKVTLLDLIYAVAIIVILVGIFMSQKNKIFKKLNIWRESANDKEDFSKLVYDMKDTVDNLVIQVNTLVQNRVDDREVSKKIREKMYGDLDIQTSGLQDSINKLTKIVLDMQEKNSKTKRAEIKEKIERIYRECNPAMVCTDMQFETLKELIEEYEEHGGTNSFVHSTVEPEMYTWEKITRIKKVDK